MDDRYHCGRPTGSQSSENRQPSHCRCHLGNRYNMSGILIFTNPAALVTTILETFFASTKNEWGLVAQKGKKWAKKLLATKGVTVDPFAEAAKYIKDKKVKLK